MSTEKLDSLIRWPPGTVGAREERMALEALEQLAERIGHENLATLSEEVRDFFFKDDPTNRPRAALAPIGGSVGYGRLAQLAGQLKTLEEDPTRIDSFNKHKAAFLAKL